MTIRDHYAILDINYYSGKKINFLEVMMLI